MNEPQRVHHTVSPSRGSAYPSNEPSQPIATRLASVQPARLELALLDPQVARELCLKSRLRVVPVVDELDRDHF